MQDLPTEDGIRSPAIVYPEESYAIVGACFEVHKAMGSGFLEAVYQECLQIELEIRRIPIRPRPLLQLRYRGPHVESILSA